MSLWRSQVPQVPQLKQEVAAAVAAAASGEGGVYRERNGDRAVRFLPRPADAPRHVNPLVFQNRTKGNEKGLSK